MNAYVLKGWGIECDEEMKRAAIASGCFGEVRELVLPKISTENWASIAWPFEKGDWVLLPGGFSFSDHFGSGKLLALCLRDRGFFEKVNELGLNLLGICNGFQVLTESGIFGASTRLLANAPGGFRNRWITLKAPDKNIRLPVRHGEGRLVWDNDLPVGVKAFLHYADEDFRNGSRELVAGLISQQGKSLICGMMPHPEIALSPLDDPDTFATDYFEQHRQGLWQEEGAGLALLRKIFNKEIL
ncbi:MAG: phosphoribosylformylglycinamidine synthase subunit PurQ [Bdellovibrionota bacterium]